MKLNAAFLFAVLSVTPPIQAQSAHDIVQKTLDVDQRDWVRAKDYTYRERQVTRESDSSGKVTSTHSRTHDVLILYGRPFSRLIEKDDKPLSESEQRKEEERFQKAIDTRKRSADDPNSKERREYEKRRADERKYVNEILNAFDFRTVGEQNLDGREAWIIEGIARPDYQAKDSRAKMLSKFHGKMWIDKATYEWVKIDTEVTDNISIGLFLARVSRGSTIRVEKKRVNEEVWLPSRVELAIDGRLALVKKLRVTVEVTYSDYKKFQTDSKVIATEAIP